MSIKAVNANIAQATADNHVSEADAKKILSTKDGWLSSPESVGTFVDKDEFYTIKELNTKISNGSIQADPEAKALLNAFVEKGAGNRVAHALTGGSIGKEVLAAGAAIVGSGGAGVGYLVRAEMVYYPSASVVAANLVMLKTTAAGIAIGIAAGYVAAMALSTIDD